MKITLYHKESKNGYPVILGDDGRVLEYPVGITLVLKDLGWTREYAAKKAGYTSERSIEKFFTDRQPTANFLNVLAVGLMAKSTNK